MSGVIQLACFLDTETNNYHDALELGTIVLCILDTYSFLSHPIFSKVKSAPKM